MNTLCYFLIFPSTFAFLTPPYDEHLDELMGEKHGLFPNAFVPYILENPSNDIRAEHIVKKAIDFIDSNTCLTFRFDPMTTHLRHPNSLVIRLIHTGNHNRTFIFKPPSFPEYIRVVYLDIHDDYHIIQARLLNAVAGLRYEHERMDRDKYIRINWDNIIEGYEDQFSKRRDYPPKLPFFDTFSHHSLMTVGPYYLSKNGKPTIELLQGRFSDYPFNPNIDMIRVNSTYSQLIHRWFFRGILNELKGPVQCRSWRTGDK